MNGILIALSILAASPESAALESAGKAFPGAMVCESERHELLQTLADEHATYMARTCRQGHQRFDSRFQRIRRELNMSAAEICAESWRRQADLPLEQVGHEMFKCWRQSPGHWRTASRKHRFWGGSMAKGRNGIWYSCIIVAD